MFEKGKLAYSFMFNDKPYGNAIKVPSRKMTDMAASCLILFTNALETFEKLNGEQNN